MNRREFLAWMGMGAAALATRRSAWAAGQPKPDHYNLLIYHCDELNFRTLGCYRKLMKPDQALVWGPKAVLDTPNIDRIAAGGAICTSFYATTPLCSPSRSSFVSGRYPQNTPVTTNNVPMSDKVVTFAEVLRRAGYATGYAGKWHLDGDGKPQWAPKRQFGFADNRYMYNRGHYKQMEDTPKGPRVKARDAHDKPTYDVKGADEKSFTTDYLTGKAMDFIRAHKDQPFCYMLSVPDPHDPNTVRPPYDTMFNDVPFEAPRTMHTPGPVPAWGPRQVSSLRQPYMQQYFGMIKCIDDNVGKVLKELDDLGLTDRTIVVFTADHGDLCGEHGRFNKGVPFEGSARIPFLVRAPGLVKPGTVVKEALSCVDFAPTILGLLGQERPRDADGRDTSGLLLGKHWMKQVGDVVFLRGASNPGKAGQWLAAVTPRYKLVVSPVDKPWFFDLEKNPDETTNFFDDPAYRDELRKLAEYLQVYGHVFKDPDVEQPLIKADLEWMAKGTGPYRNPPRPKAPAKKGKKARKAAKKKQ